MACRGEPGTVDKNWGSIFRHFPISGLERETRLELATSTWQGCALPTELFPQNQTEARTGIEPMYMALQAAA